MWPQGDIGVVLWSLSVAADEWQGTDTLAALCTVPDRWIPTAHGSPRPRCSRGGFYGRCGGSA